MLYTNDRSTQIVLSLLKAYGIKIAVVSPGTTNIPLVVSMQRDPFFKVYSSVDERSAAYLACGLASESDKPVVLSCTEATASRNYFPGLTEAFYRKLPILAITGTHGSKRAGHLFPQVIDRSVTPKDTVNISVDITSSFSSDTEWINTINITKAIWALFDNGGGPSHINLQYANVPFETKEFKPVRVIRKITCDDTFPDLPGAPIAIIIGSHKIMSEELTLLIDTFCIKYNAVVFCDHTSSFKGKYGIKGSLIGGQKSHKPNLPSVKLIIHLGEISGDTYTPNLIKSKVTWRICKDGELRDRFNSLTYLFQLSEERFFTYYNMLTDNRIDPPKYYLSCLAKYNELLSKIPELPFGNVWIAQQLHDSMPVNSTIHFSIYNSLRSWNFFDINNSIVTNCNVGGFGIDGALSTLIGASLLHPDKIYYLITGDLAFFYDMNVLGNRHLGKNIRIMLINNAKGTEFVNYGHPANPLGVEAEAYIAAAGHFGNKSKELVKHYAQDLGFKYYCALNKDDFFDCKQSFLSLEIDQPILFEVFTDSYDESFSLKIMRNLIVDKGVIIKESIKKVIKTITSK